MTSNRVVFMRLVATVVGLLALVIGGSAAQNAPVRIDSGDDHAVFAHGENISSRFVQLYQDGLMAPPLEITDADLPHEIRLTLSARAVDWQNLGGTQQRLVLWDAGFVVTRKRHLARIYVECGLTMDEIVISRDQIHASGCPVRQCGDALAEDVSCGAAIPTRCAAEGLDVDEPSNQVLSWTEEQPNFDIPRPTLFRTANQSYTIHMFEGGTSASDERCPSQLRLAIPCANVQNTTAEWCVPKPTGIVSTFLGSLLSTPITRSSDSRSSANAAMSIVWLVVMCVAGVASVVFVIVFTRINAKKNAVDQTKDVKQLPAPTTTVTSETELDFVSVHSEARSLAVFAGKSTRSLGAFSSNISSYCDLMNASEVLQAFQNDPLVQKKRIPMVDIEFTRRLCHGASGDVFVGCVYGQRVAIKQLLKLKRNDIDDVEWFAREIQLTATLDHPNIIKMIGVAWDTFHDMALVLEYRSGGDLLNALRKRGSRWSWNAEKLQVAIGVAKGMVFLHSRAHPIVHRDIKSRNVLIDAATLEPALCDFGASRNVSALDLLSTDPAGTILWSAPEVICSQNYTVKADIFSFGVVLAELDTCTLPYTTERDSEGRTIQAIRIAHMVVENRVKPHLSEHCPRFIRELVMKCVKHKPEKRPTAEELLNKLTEAANDCAALWKSKTFGMESL